MKRPAKKKLVPTVSNSSVKELAKEKTPEPAVVEKSPEPPAEIMNENKPQVIERNESAANKPEKNVENFESIESAFASGSEDFTFSSKTPEPFAPSPGADSTGNTTTSEVLDKSGRESASTNATLDDTNNEWSNPFITNVTPEPTANINELKPDDVSGQVKQPSPVPGEEVGEDGGEAPKPKLMTEEAAKAALAEKRRLAREAAEREAARIAEVI